MELGQCSSVQYISIWNDDSIKGLFMVVCNHCSLGWFSFIRSHHFYEVGFVLCLSFYHFIRITLPLKEGGNPSCQFILKKPINLCVPVSNSIHGSLPSIASFCIGKCHLSIWKGEKELMVHTSQHFLLISNHLLRAHNSVFWPNPYGSWQLYHN